MAALLDISLRSAESTDEEVAQALPGSIQFFRRVHRAKDVVAGNLLVERPRESIEAVLPDDVE